MNTHPHTHTHPHTDTHTHAHTPRTHTTHTQAHTHVRTHAHTYSTCQHTHTQTHTHTRNTNTHARAETHPEVHHSRTYRYQAAAGKRNVMAQTVFNRSFQMRPSAAQNNRETNGVFTLVTRGWAASDRSHIFDAGVNFLTRASPT